MFCQSSILLHYFPRKFYNYAYPFETHTHSMYWYVFLQPTYINIGSSSMKSSGCEQGRGNYFEVGGGQKSPGVQGDPYPELKTHRIWPTIFGRNPNSCAKTNKNKIERH